MNLIRHFVAPIYLKKIFRKLRNYMKYNKAVKLLKAEKTFFFNEEVDTPFTILNIRRISLLLQTKFSF